MKFAISPDEPPGDPGTTAGGIIERDLNILVGNELVKALQRCGQSVWFDPSLQPLQRVTEANANGTDVLFICAHNYSVGGMGEGTVFIFCPGGRAIGKQMLAAQNVGAELIAAGLSGRWVAVDEQLYETCNFNKDSVWCEFLYQSNAQDLATIKSPGYPTRAAEAACKGLAKTYGFAYVPPAFGPGGGTATQEDDMLFVDALHALPASVKTFSGGNVYALPSASAPVVGTFGPGQQLALKGFRYSSSAVASSDRGGGAGAGPDNVWWELDSGHWYPDADLDTTQVVGAPIGAAVSTLPAGMRSYFVTIDDPAVTPAPAPQPDDDSAFVSKAALKTAIGSL
jgi:N-acetylmuramoyl-L-alanine amidase